MPRKSRAQTNPPSVPISKLYSGGNYPKGMEMPYTVILMIFVKYAVAGTHLHSHKHVHAHTRTHAHTHTHTHTHRMTQWPPSGSPLKRSEPWTELRMTSTPTSGGQLRLTGNGSHCELDSFPAVSGMGNTIALALFPGSSAHSVQVMAATVS